ncbi:unnamed protein product [Cyprideis torosa]|uniref:O-acyltransferase WSD1 C-terminal domain-containing protein n=1 Tax=Cyprideis torosa TaxID=163714 RepID=A0A7R8WJ44_9CRUS|nr:unnamed protein product [Cyprideis torosa]CAG0895224.1 unnamed protein product [Cyprideis torosa]
MEIGNETNAAPLSFRRFKANASPRHGSMVHGFSTTLPMAQGLKPSDFIQAIKLETSKIKESTKIYTPAHLACTYNLLPTLVTAKFSGIASTSTPGPTERFTILGGREVDRFFTTGMIPTNCGGLIVGWSRYSEHVSVTVSVDGSVLQLLKTTTEQILDTFLQQLLELENYHPV